MSAGRRAETVQQIWVTLQVNASKQGVCPQHRSTNTDAEIYILSKATNFMTVSRTVDIHRPVINAISQLFFRLCLTEEASAFSVGPQADCRIVQETTQ